MLIEGDSQWSKQSKSERMFVNQTANLDMFTSTLSVPWQEKGDEMRIQMCSFGRSQSIAEQFSRLGVDPVDAAVLDRPGRGTPA